MDSFTQYAMAAAKIAFEMSGLDMEKEDSFRAGAIVASGIGGIKTLEEQHDVFWKKAPEGSVRFHYVDDRKHGCGKDRYRI